MNAPWFDPHLAWLPGTLLGILCGLFGSSIGVLFPLSSRKKRWIGLGFLRMTYWLLLLCSAGFFLGGIVAFCAEQPDAIWYGLGLAGGIGLLVLGSVYAILFRLPKQIETEWMAPEEK